MADTHQVVLWLIHLNKPIARDNVAQFCPIFRRVAVRWAALIVSLVVLGYVLAPAARIPPPPAKRDCPALLAAHPDMCGCDMGNGGVVLRSEPHKVLWGVRVVSRVGRQLVQERRIADCGPNAEATWSRRPSMLIFSYFPSHEASGEPVVVPAGEVDSACLDAMIENADKVC